MTTQTAYIDHLRQAVEHFHDPEWLGSHSPLATPYFLGNLLTNETTAVSRGRRLQTLIHTAAAALWDGPLPTDRHQLAAAAFAQRDELGATKSPRYSYLLLELYYLRRHFSPRQEPPPKVNDILDFAATSKTRFFSHLKQVVNDVGEQLLRLAQPTFRLETPRLTHALVGRQPLLEQAVAQLQQGHSVAISGGGGMGKTALATAVSQQWPHPVFYYTIRPGLNDQLDSLLFALGHFLHQHGASRLWLQRLADHSQTLNTDLVLGLLRDDLHAVGQPLLCFDELDRLGDLMQRHPQQSQLLEFIDGLQAETPLLLLGQQVPLDARHHIHLEGLAVADMPHFFAQAGLDAISLPWPQLHHLSHGNPRLLEIIAALYQSGESLPELRRAPALVSLLERLWKRLDGSHHRLLGQLAVFQQPAPADIWPADVVEQLTQRRLVQPDAQGGLALLPLIQEVLQGQLPPELRDQYHQQAATIWAERGAYTAAAYHFWQAGEAETAVSLWYPHRQLEIERGQAAAARHIFGQISLHRLPKAAQRQLKQMRNQLYLLAGEVDKVLAEAGGIEWPSTVEGQRGKTAVLAQEAHATTILGDHEAARARYDEAILTLGQLANDILDKQFVRTTTHFLLGDKQAALAEVARAKYEAARLEGFVHWRLGNFPEAHTHLATARTLANALNNPQAVAQTERLLLYNSSHAGQLAQAQHHAEAAIRYYQQVGDQFNLAGTQASLASAYINARDFSAAIPPSEQALAFFQKIKSTSWVAAISSNLAEAYFETGNLAQAKAMAFAVLQLEDPYSHPYALYTLGLIHQHEQAMDNARESFRRGITVAQQNGDKFIEAYLQRGLGVLYRSCQQPDPARSSLEIAQRLFAEMQLAAEVERTEAEIVRLPA